jgi:hypothetical protein
MKLLWECIEEGCTNTVEIDMEWIDWNWHPADTPKDDGLGTIYRRNSGWVDGGFNLSENWKDGKCQLHRVKTLEGRTNP